MSFRLWVVSAVSVASMLVVITGCRGRSTAESTRNNEGARESFAPAPDFTLLDTTGQSHTLADYRGRWVVLEWMNHGCPFVKRHYDTGNMQRLQREYGSRDVIWLSICSSAPGMQGHMTNEQWNEITAQKQASPLAVLVDEDGHVGRLYSAVRTPGMFIISPDQKIIYSGAIDDKPSADHADVDRANNYVRDVLEAVLAGERPPITSTSPYGCTVKYAGQ